MAENRIDSIIDNPAIEAEIANVEKRLSGLATTLKTFPKADLLSNASNQKELNAALKENATALSDLKVKNLELSNAIKQQQLVSKQAAEERRAAVQLAKEQAAADKEASKQAQIAASEKIRALQAQKKAEEELRAAEEARTNAENERIVGTNKSTGGLNANKPVTPAFIPANDIESNLLNLTKTETALKANQAAQKNLGDQLKANEISQEEYNASIVKARAQELEYKKTIQLTNAELKARTNAEFAIQGSIDAAKAQNALLIPERNAVPVGDAASEEDVARLKELNAEIDKNNDLIDKNNDLLGRQKINIGNYPNAFGAAFKTLNTELEQVQGKLVSGNFKGKEFEELTAKLNVLKNATSLTGKEFTTVAQQQKAYAEASTQIGLVYGKNSEVFKNFSAGVKEGNVNIKGLASEVSNVASKGKGFMGFLNNAYGGIRKLAYAIPGLGIGGIILLLLGPLESLGAALIKSGNAATKSGRDFQDLQEHIKNTNAVVEKSADSFSKATSEVLKLKEDVQLAKEGFLDKNKVLKEYNETMGKTTGHLNDFDQLEAKLVADGPDYIQLLFLKAKATAAYALAGEAARKALTAQADAEKDFSNTDFVATNKLQLLKQAFGFGDLGQAGINSVKQIKKNADEIKKTQEKAFADLNQQGADYEKQAAELAKKRGFNFFDPEKDKAAKKSQEDSERLADDFRKKDLEALAKFTKDELTILKNRYKEEADDQNRSLEDRLKSVQDYYKVSAQLIANDIKAQEDALNLEVEVANKKAAKIGDPKKRADAQNAIEQYRIDKLKTIQQEGLTATTQLEKELYKENTDIAEQSYAKIQKAAEDAYKVIAREAKIAYQNQKDSIDINKDDQLLQLEKDFAAGRIKNVEDYNNKKQAIEEAADIKQKELDLKRIREAELVVEALYGLKNLNLIKQAKDLEVEINEKANKKIADSDTKLKEKKKELRDQLETTFQDIIEGSFDRSQQKNEADLKSIDEKSQKEIDAINASGLAEEEKQKRIMAIQKQADFQKQQIEKRQKQQDVQRARFERAASIARIVQSTAEAIIATLGAKPWTPANIALAAITGAIGAAQIATVLAQPIPHYEKGTRSAKRGLAVVGEKGSELMERNGQMFITPGKPTLVDLAGGEKIFRHDITKDMLNHYNLLSIIQKVQSEKQPIKVENGFNQRAIDILNKIERKAPFIIQVGDRMETTDYYMRNIKN